MAGKAGQIIPRGERTWLVRVFMGRDSESGKRKYVNKTIHGTLRDAQAYLSRSQRDRDLGVFFEPSRMSLDDLFGQVAGDGGETETPSEDPSRP